LGSWMLKDTRLIFPGAVRVWGIMNTFLPSKTLYFPYPPNLHLISLLYQQYLMQQEVIHLAVM
ncbi:uncharacterized protein A4U43_C01F18710, partial [Asparagus officinalis]